MSLIVAYLLLGFFFLMERLLRQGEQAKTLEAGESDRNSTLLIGLAFAAAVVLGPVLTYNNIGRVAHAEIVGWIGVAIIVAGTVLRFLAMRTLGVFYTRTLRVSRNQAIVQSGPYRLIRHPGYLATMMIWIGAGLAAQNWIAALLIALLMIGAYTYRIRSEEAMLLNAFGDDYRNYRSRTWSLVPFVY